MEKAGKFNNVRIRGILSNFGCLLEKYPTIQTLIEFEKLALYIKEISRNKDFIVSIGGTSCRDWLQENIFTEV